MARTCITEMSLPLVTAHDIPARRSPAPRGCIFQGLDSTASPESETKNKKNEGCSRRGDKAMDAVLSGGEIPSYSWSVGCRVYI